MSTAKRRRVGFAPFHAGPPGSLRSPPSPFGGGMKLKRHLVAALEHEDLARLVGRRDLEAEPLDDLARLA